MSYLIKIGGSLLFDANGNIELEKLSKFSEMIQSVPSVKAIVCGGGSIARKYIQAGRKLKINESGLDLLGIDVSRINAKLLIFSLGSNAYPVVIKSIDEALESSLSKKIIIAGGFVPGQSTTTVAMQIAECLNLEGIFVLTDVDAIYNKNPKKYPDAKKFDQIKVDELEKIILQDSEDSQSAAGEYRIFDAVSIQIFKRSAIKVRLVNGNKLDELKTTLKDGIEKSKNGTLIIR